MTIQRLSLDGNKILSHGVKHGGVVTTAGIVADDVTAGAKGQAEQILKTIDKVLAHFGTDKSKLLTAYIWVSDIRHRAAVNEAWLAWVDPNALPVRATVEAALADPAMLVEIQVSAAA
jgi:enamine deaminase RidA (YjgF/YER057c/UK114 family)